MRPMNQQAWYPIINYDLCTGCADCVMECPTEALVMSGCRPVLIQPDACGYCAICEAVCPEEAIALPYRVVVESRS